MLKERLDVRQIAGIIVFATLGILVVSRLLLQHINVSGSSNQSTDMNGGLMATL